MTLREMEIFLAVIEHKTMHKASQELFISQPTISGVVATMEEELGVKLFERLGKRLYLTEYGENIKKYAIQIINTHKEMIESIHDINIKERLKIGATVSVGGKLLNQILSNWEGQQPFVQVTNTHEIEKKILNSQLDCAIVEGEIHSPDLIKIPMFKDKMYLLCSVKNEKFKEKKTSLNNLDGEMLIMREEGSGTRERILQMIKENDLNVTMLWQSNTIEAIFHAVRNNIGVTILSEKLLIKDKMMKKIIISDCDLNRIFNFVYHKDKFQSKTFKQFLQTCQKTADIQL